MDISNLPSLSYSLSPLQSGNISYHLPWNFSSNHHLQWGGGGRSILNICYCQWLLSSPLLLVKHCSLVDSLPCHFHSYVSLASVLLKPRLSGFLGLLFAFQHTVCPPCTSRVHCFVIHLLSRAYQGHHPALTHIMMPHLKVNSSQFSVK